MGPDLRVGPVEVPGLRHLHVALEAVSGARLREPEGWEGVGDGLGMGWVEGFGGRVGYALFLGDAGLRVATPLPTTS